MHIDLTSNPAVETAGIMALAVGLRANKIVRCLDLTVGMGDEEGAGLSRDILQSCIRNTELAQDKSSTKAARQAVWAPIQRSTLARQAKEADSARAMAEAQSSAATPAGQARSTVFEMSPDEVESAAEEVVQSLTEGVEVSDALGVVVKDVQGVLERAKVLRERLEEMVQQSVDGDGGDRLQVLLGLMDRLTVQVDVAEKAVEADTAKQAQAIEDDKVKQRQPLKISTNLGPAGGLFPSPNVSTPVKNVPAEMASSPNFTLADSSDEDDDDDEEDDDDMGGLPGLPPPDSPTVQKSLKMVEEEGEVFRKGVVLGTADAEQGEEVSTEKLKQEVRLPLNILNQRLCKLMTLSSSLCCSCSMRRLSDSRLDGCRWTKRRPVFLRKRRSEYFYLCTIPSHPPSSSASLAAGEGPLDTLFLSFISSLSPFHCRLRARPHFLGARASRTAVALPAGLIHGPLSFAG